jgi:tetratricopeptide (TPR) repeat protein
MAKPTLNLSQALSRAISAYNAGKLVEAEQICQQIINIKRDLFDALHLLAVVQSRLGKKDTALASYDRALALRPDYAEAFSNRGVTLHELKRFEEALASYDRALTLRPDYAEAFCNRGLTLHKLKRFEEALASYDCALALRPDYAEALSNRGLTLHELKRFEEALASYDRALKARPDYAEALSNRGVTLHELKRFEEALASYDRALKVRPDYAEALSNRGVTLHELKRFAAALASYDRALKVRPDYADALSNRGVTLHELKQFEEALASYDRALILRPDSAEVLCNRGNTLKELKRFAEALASYDRALKVRPDYAEALCNRGVTLKELKRFAEALASYDRALKVRPDYAEALLNRGVTLKELKRFEEALTSNDRALTARPDFAEAHWNEALLRLLTGDFDRGWEKHEWRWETEQQRNEKRNFARPQWTGQQDITSKTILLHAEQGFGDTIQFCRYVPRVVERAERVILEVPKSLHELMSTLAGVAEIVCRGDPLPDFDIHSPLLSLPLAFGTRLESIPSTTPYLQAPTHALQRWQMRLGPRDRLRIGICWAGNANFKGDLNRSIGLPPLLPLLSSMDVQFFSIQKDLRAGDLDILQNNSQITHLGKEIETFSDTAAIISLMDLVISSDTSVVHLAGALGKPVWILLQFVPDWRWLLDREDSPWYPTARLFRQDETRQWDNVIARVHVALHVYVRSL